MNFGDLSTAEGLKALDEHLSDRSYVDSFEPTQADASVFQMITLSKVPQSLPHLTRWYKHIQSFGSSVSKFAPSSAASIMTGTPKSGGGAAAPEVSSMSLHHTKDFLTPASYSF